MSGTITFDELFPVSDNPNTGFRLFGFNQADTKNEAITISQIIALLELTAPAWAEITGKPTAFPPSAHSFGSHTQVDSAVDTAPDGRLLRRQGGVWAPWTPDFLTSETDPTVPAHVKNITETEKANWNSAFAWGNHAGNYRPVNWVPSWSQVTDKPASFPAEDHSLGSHSNVASAIDSATAGQLVRRGATQFEAWTPNFLTEESDPYFHASPAAEITLGEIASWNAKLNEWSEFPDSTIPMIKDGIAIPSGILGVWSVNPFDPETEPEDYDAFVSELLHLISTKRIKGPDAVDADDYVTKGQLDQALIIDPAPQEGIVTRGTITFDSPTSVDIDGYEWNYEGVLQEGGLEENKTIPGTPSEFNRIDALVGDNAGNYYWIEGTEDENQVLEPAIPTDRRLLEYILRTPAGDNTLEPVTPDLTIYVDKVSTGNQTIQSDLTIAKFARPTYSRNRIEADVNGKLRRVDDEDLFSGNHSDLNLNDGTNPHGTTKSDLGLGNVDNTSDLNKPISNATQTALNQKANSADLAEVATSGDYEDLINAPIPFFDLDFTWEFDGNKTYTFPSSFDLVRINWVSLYGIILPKDNIAYTVNPTTKTLTLGSLYTPSLGDKLVISSRLINT